MNKRTRVIALSLLIVLVAWAAHAGKEVAFDETFDVGSGGTLELTVDDMDIEVKAGGSDQARVVVTLSGNLERAREKFEDSEFEAHRKGNTLVVETRERRHGWSWSWSSGGRADILVTVTVPAKFNVNAKTSDGNITADGIEGEFELKTSDGDVDLGKLAGTSIFVKTSDGNITARAIEADDVELQTSDGDIKADGIKGSELSLETADGDVDVDDVAADKITARTSDGDLRLVVSGSSLTARTSDGDIDVQIEDKMEVELTASDGDIVIRAPKGIGADVDLKGERVKLDGKVALDGEVGRRRVTGILGDGGPKLRARTSDGNVSLQFY